jgi:hypothetical protein
MKIGPSFCGIAEEEECEEPTTAMMAMEIRSWVPQRPFRVQSAFDVVAISGLPGNDGRAG